MFDHNDLVVVVASGSRAVFLPLKLVKKIKNLRIFQQTGKVRTGH